ncbi:hypothetical protein B0H14DRAFT_2591353 [Mycena olivaceomarginata]|nr:hypothetical protein B0H14DRAFT_2591353 [Mycena olivaceomarginata]
MRFNFFSLAALASLAMTRLRTSGTSTSRLRPSRLESATATHTVAGPILIAWRTYDNTTSPPIVQFTAVLPSWFHFTDATYSLELQNSFARAGPTGESVITTGGILTPITITGF